MELEARRDLGGVQVHLVDHSDMIIEFKRWLSERRPDEAIAFDLETSGLSPWDKGARIRLAQIGDGMTGWAIPWDRWPGLVPETLDEFDGIIEGHNIGFDIKWMEQHTEWRAPWSRVRDSMIAARLVNPLFPAGLKSQADRFIDRRASLGQKLLDEAFVKHGWSWDTVPVDFEPYWSYGALDTVLTRRINEMYEPAVGPGGPYAEAYDLEMATLRITTRMEQRGARVDLDYCQRMFDKCHDYEDSIKQWARESYGGLNIGSPGALARKFTELGGEIENFTPGGSPKVDKWQLQMFSDPDNGWPIAVQRLAEQTLLQRKYSKLASSYFENFLTKNVDGIVHAEINPMAARTGRMSISNPALQQLPRGDALVRTAFIPRDGNVLIATDFSQIEMRMMAHFSDDPELQKAFIDADESGGDFFVNIGREVYSDPTFSKSDKRRGLIKGCVPLTTEILTKRGWLTYDQVVTGDETYGYDFESGQSRWTSILSVHVFDDPDDPTPVYRLANANRELFCTSNHRWVVDNGRGGSRGTSSRIANADEIPGTENRIILAAQAESGSLDITPDEAAVLGWIFGDGHVKRSPATGATSQGVNGWRIALKVLITQTKVHEREKIAGLLTSAGIPSKSYVSATGQQVWTLDASYCRDLFSRAGIGLHKNDFDAWTLATGLTHDARVAMADALDAADGKHRIGLTAHFNVVQAANTQVTELCVALGFLLGKFSRIRTIEPDGKGWQRSTIQTVEHQKPIMTGQRAVLEYVEDAPVWCVTTGLGTWTMRQVGDRTPVLTGNTMYGMGYGAGVGKMAETAGVPTPRMQEVVNALTSRYPGIKNFMRQVEDIGKRREMAEGEGYVNGIDGRRLPCDSGKVYTLVNYLIQGGAAVAYKRSLLRLDAAGYGDTFLVPVHDEIVMDLPAEDAADALIDVPRVMKDTSFAVPIPADAEGPFSRSWGEKYAS